MGIKYIEKNSTYKIRHNFRIPPELGGGEKNFVREGIKTKRQAEQIYFEMKVKAKEYIRGKTVPTWEGNVLNYISFLEREDRSKKAIENTWLALKAHTLPAWGNRPIPDICGREIRELIKFKLANRAVATQKDVLKFIRGAFKFALEEGHIKTNPTPAMKFRMVTRLKKGLNEEQIKILLSKARLHNSEWYYIYAVAAYTGMRTGELFALTWEQVDLESRQIMINQVWTSKDGFKGYTKSGKDRIAVISLQLLEILKELKLKTGGVGFVLPRLKKWERGDQARELKKFLTGIGLPEMTFHGIRASWATILLNKGVDPLKVMKMGGWEDYKTMKFYIYKAGIDIKGITDKLDLAHPCDGETMPLQKSEVNYL